MKVNQTLVVVVFCLHYWPMFHYYHLFEFLIIFFLFRVLLLLYPPVLLHRILKHQHHVMVSLLVVQDHLNHVDHRHLLKNHDLVDYLYWLKVKMDHRDWMLMIVLHLQQHYSQMMMNQIMVVHLQVVWNGVEVEVVDVHVVVLVDRNQVVRNEVDRNEVHLMFNKKLILRKIEVSYHSFDFDREYRY